MTTEYQGIKFSDEDIVNPDDACFQGDGSRKQGYLLHDHGFVLAVVFADDYQDALDEAADSDKLDRYRVCNADLGDYPNEDGISYLGNTASLYDIESLQFIELPLPKASFVAQFKASQESRS